MPINEMQRKELTKMRTEAGEDSLRKEQLVDFLLEKSTATYLDGMLFETPLASIPHECFATYVNETVQHLCGAKGQNRRTLRMLAELLIMTHHAIGRLHMDSGAPPNIQELQVKCNLAATLTAEARRLVAAIEALRSEVETACRTTAEPTRGKGRGAKIKLASNGD